METKAEALLANAAKEYQTALSRWVRFTDEVVNNSMRLGRPLINAYLQSLSDTVPAIKEVARTSMGKGCEIPETQCPPYCVCELDWDACEDSQIKGSINITNTGQNAVNFTLQAGTFKSEKDESGKKPDITPASFTLAPGASQAVVVKMSVGSDFDPNDRYETEIKIRGRYEQCVKLRLFVRRNTKPHCSIDHGEIPRRIVAHNWYDHFQCEELCFEPIKQRHPGSDKPVGTTGKVAAKAVKKTKG